MDWCDATWQTDSRVAHAAVHDVLLGARIQPRFARVVVVVVVVVTATKKKIAKHFGMVSMSEHMPWQFLPSLVGDACPSTHAHVRDEGVAQSPVHQVLMPHLSWHVLTD